MRIIYFDDLTDAQKERASNNGSGKEYATYLKIDHDGKILSIESDAMEPEDATFGRDLSWVGEMILEAYRLGHSDGKS